MESSKKKDEDKKFDSKEFDLPETVYIRDIENRVFQAIILQTLAKIENISLAEGNFIDNIFGKGGFDSLRGITATQDNKNHAVKIRIEVGIDFGVAIPEKAEEIQTKVTEEVTRLTGLHVSSIHVVFKNLNPPGQHHPSMLESLEEESLMLSENIEKKLASEMDKFRA